MRNRKKLNQVVHAVIQSHGSLIMQWYIHAAMASIQNDRAPQGGHFSAMNRKNNTTAVVLFLPQGLQLPKQTNIFFKFKIHSQPNSAS